MSAPASIAVLGDSVVEDIDSLYGKLSVPDRILTLLDRAGIGRSGHGFYGLWRDEWTLTGSWTRATTADAWDKGPLLGSTTGCGTFTASGSGFSATWTRPSGITVTGVTVHVIDGPSAGNFSYRIDGGAWTNVSNTWTGDNSYDRLTIGTPVTSTFEIRCANASGTSVQTYLVGLEAHDSGLTGRTTVHTLAASSEFSYAARRTGSGDWTAWWDVTQPAYAIVQCPFSNDVTFWPTDQATIQTNMSQIVSVLQANGAEVVLFSSPEQSGRDTTVQAQMRAYAASLAASTGCRYIDFYSLWGDYAAANAAGLMLDTVHPSPYGCGLMAQRLIGPVLARASQTGRFRA